MVDASDLAALLLMKERGLLKPFKSTAIDAVAKDLRDPDGTWITDRLTQAVIQFNTKEFGSAPPATWADLGKAAMNGRLVYFSSANGDGAPRIYTLARHLGWDVVKAMAATKPLRVQTPQVITQVLERGERGAGFLQNDNIAWRSKLQGKPTDYVFPAEGVPTEIGACGLLKSSARPHAAALFHEWWMGAEGQAILVKGGKYSSRTDVAPPEGSTPLSKLKLLTLDYAEYKKDKTKILDQMAGHLRRRVGQLSAVAPYESLKDWACQVPHRRARHTVLAAARERAAPSDSASQGVVLGLADRCCCCSWSAIRCCGWCSVRSVCRSRSVSSISSAPSRARRTTPRWSTPCSLRSAPAS